MRRLALILLVVAASYIALATPATPQAGFEPDVFRAERALPGSPVARSGCSSDTCVVGLIAPVLVTIPSSMGAVDLTATLTVEYRTTEGVPALLAVKIKSPGEQFQLMKPGALTLRDGSMATTSATWFVDGVASSDPISIGVRFQKRGPASRPWNITLHEAVLVVEAVPNS